jgi:hypothetical protein
VITGPDLFYTYIPFPISSRPVVRLQDTTCESGEW